MSEQLRESVSAVMDGEASELELRRVLSRDNTDVVNNTWSRYHAVKNVLHNSDNELSFRNWDISQQISEAVADEPLAAVKKANSAGLSWMRPVAGFAVAASVAFAVVVGVQSIQPGGIDADPSSLSSQPAVASRVYPLQSSSPQASGNVLVGANFAGQNDLPGARATSKAAADLEAQKRLEKYLLRHTERAALNNGRGMISFARVASFETE